MSQITGTYSFLDLSVVITNPILPVPITFAGSIGVGELIVAMHTERTAHDLAADGNIMVSYIPGDNGEFTITAQQTSPIHQALLTLYNLLVAAANNGDVSNWAATAISARNVTTQSSHQGTGCSFGKIPDKPYQSQGQKVTWRILSANVVNN